MIPMKQASLLNGWLFLAVIFAGFLSLLYPVGHFFVTEPAAWQQFRQGELVRKLERRVDEEFVLRKPSIAFWADTSFLLFKAGRPGVLVGERKTGYSAGKNIITTAAASVFWQITLLSWLRPFACWKG